MIKIEDLDYSNIPDENKNGDCYKSALEVFQDFYQSGEKDIKLVHGVVTGQGPIAGTQYGHAWVELNDRIVLDFSNDREIVMPIDQYYKLGKIEITKKYDVDEVLELMSTKGTYGPWDKLFDDYY